MKSTHLALVSILSLGSAAHAWLPAIISDHMVLQAGKPAPLWGRDLPGKTVTVSLAGQTLTAQTGEDGRWSLQFPALQPGGPYELVVSGAETTTVKDVMVGQVWLGSGQSNMEFPLKNTRDRDKDVAAAEKPLLRLFTVERVASFGAQPDVQGSWKLCTPASAKDFSAVAYHFGDHLSQALGQSVGLIVASWGGTPGEDWAPRSDLETVPALATLFKEWDKDSSRLSLWQKGRPYQLELADLKLVPRDERVKPLKITTDPTAWRHGEKPGSTGGLSRFEGALKYTGLIQGGAWGSMAFDLAGGQPKNLKPYRWLEFDARGRGDFVPAFGQPSIDDYDFYAGSQFSVSGAWKHFYIDLDKLKQGGWGAPRELTLDKISHLQFATQVPFWPEYPAVAYDGMIAPLQPFALAGVLWYQGESNAGRAKDYEALLKALVGSWRKGFKDESLPFFVVQLPNYGSACDKPCESGWASLRDAQRRAVDGLSKAGLAVAIDQGDPQDIHPRHKTVVAKRLADLALGTAYGKTAPRTPRLLSVTAQSDGTLRLDFEPSALSVKEGQTTALGFELAGKDKVFSPATALARGPQIYVTHAAVKEPRWVRYAWADDALWSVVDAQSGPLGSFEAEVNEIQKVSDNETQTK